MDLPLLGDFVNDLLSARGESAAGFIREHLENKPNSGFQSWFVARRIINGDGCLNQVA